MKGGVLNSMLAILIDVSRLGGSAAVAEHVAATKAHIRSSRTAPGFTEVLLPGEPEQRRITERGERGIEVDDTTWRDIREAASTLGITAAEIERTIGANTV